MSMRAEQDLVDRYRARAERFSGEAARYAAWSRLVSYARVVVFLSAAGAFFWGLGRTTASRAAVAAGAGLGALFGGLVVAHARIDRRERWWTTLAGVNEEAIARILRDWDRLPAVPPARTRPDGVAADLDLFGRASILTLLGAGTPAGADTLTNWLETPADPDVVRARQAAVAELARDLEFRQEFVARGRLASGTAVEGQLARFLAWAESPPWLARRPWLEWLAAASGFATVALLAGQAAGLLDRALWAMPLVTNLGLMALYQVKVHQLLDRASAPDLALRDLSSLLELLARARFEAPELRRLGEQLSAAGHSAADQVRRLDRIHGFANLRHSAAIFHFPIQALTLWDFHVLGRLERWQIEVGPRLRGWLDAIGQVDGLTSLAGLRHDNPEWGFAEIVESNGPAFRAEALGHPLIPAAARVSNDVELGPPGTVLLVTGSNMSGKSTLLRSIGVAAALAQAGGPVCARALRLSPVGIETSMRVQDSLEAGVSYFMAALQRLKGIVDRARQATAAGRTVLYLLDEILQGTNTAERQTATRRIVRYLLAQNAIGAMTTHDLGLAEDPELRPACRAVHFSETVHEAGAAEAMSFDYRLRPGTATSRNALRLMKLMGLDG